MILISSVGRAVPGCTAGARGLVTRWDIGTPPWLSSRVCLGSAYPSAFLFATFTTTSCDEPVSPGSSRGTLLQPPPFLSFLFSAAASRVAVSLPPVDQHVDSEWPIFRKKEQWYYGAGFSRNSFLYGQAFCSRIIYRYYCSSWGLKMDQFRHLL